jgi:hypothetical protein
MQHATVLVGPSGTLSLRRLKLTAQARGFENVVTINVDLSNAVVAQEADLESCETLAAILSSDPSLVGFSCFHRARCLKLWVIRWGCPKPTLCRVWSSFLAATCWWLQVQELASICCC